MRRKFWAAFLIVNVFVTLPLYLPFPVTVTEAVPAFMLSL